MLKKRIIFTLLYNGDSFALSRNFRLQRVGDLDWLLQNYDFEKVASFIDELIVLNVTRGPHNLDSFLEALKAIAANCFIPIAAGGNVRSVDQARSLLRSGADKIVVNTPLFRCNKIVKFMTQEFGQQCVVGSVDLKKESDGSYRIYTDQGSHQSSELPGTLLGFLNEQLIGELYLNSINQDGTGQGFDFQLLDLLPKECPVPIILAGGAGNGAHLAQGLAEPRVSAVATAHLYNFVGDGLQRARESLLEEGVDLAIWPAMSELQNLSI